MLLVLSADAVSCESGWKAVREDCQHGVWYVRIMIAGSGETCGRVAVTWTRRCGGIMQRRSRVARVVRLLATVLRLRFSCNAG